MKIAMVCLIEAKVPLPRNMMDSPSTVAYHIGRPSSVGHASTCDHSHRGSTLTMVALNLNDPAVLEQVAKKIYGTHQTLHLEPYILG